ncbi:MAG: helix-turn-helix domain-containing protein [Bifidobacteriaceae bacterium]|jgi:hypothetical protein|nr:helix-turn-helix domain-containing protein [Bifidobacteriaceae bacterium]
MKISPELIYEELSEHFSVERLSAERTDYRVGGVLFGGQRDAMEPGWVYVVSEDDLPEQPSAPSACAIIAVGCRPAPAWLRGDRPVYVVADEATPAEILNAVQRIFARYNDWDAALASALDDAGNVAAMLLASGPLLSNPLTVLNDRLEIVAGVAPEERAAAKDQPWRLLEYNHVPLDRIARLRTVFKLTRLGTPYLHDDGGYERVYSINVTLKDCFRGNISISELCQPFRDSVFPLFEHLAGYIRRALEYQITILHSEPGPVKALIGDILDGARVDAAYAEAVLERTTFSLGSLHDLACMVLAPDDDTSLQIPEYMVRATADRLPDCVVLSRGQEIVVLAQTGGERTLERLGEQIKPVLVAAGFHAGISETFDGLAGVRVGYAKALCALKSGLNSAPTRLVYQFEDQAFAYMLKQALGEFQLHEILTPGIRRLVVHDETGKTSYVECLRCFLDNQMNLAKTARDLHLHRTSLSDRLMRVFALLGTRLTGPDERLHCALLLRLLADQP